MKPRIPENSHTRSTMRIKRRNCFQASHLFLALGIKLQLPFPAQAQQPLQNSGDTHYNFGDGGCYRIVDIIKQDDSPDVDSREEEESRKTAREALNMAGIPIPSHARFISTKAMALIVGAGAAPPAGIVLVFPHLPCNQPNCLGYVVLNRSHRNFASSIASIYYSKLVAASTSDIFTDTIRLTTFAFPGIDPTRASVVATHSQFRVVNNLPVVDLEKSVTTILASAGREEFQRYSHSPFDILCSGHPNDTPMKRAR